MTSPPASQTDSAAGSRKPLRISWSKIREHEECRQKSYLKATGHKSPVMDVRNFFQGNVVDRCMRNWLDAAEQNPGVMAAMVEQELIDSEARAKDTGDGVIKWRHASDRDQLKVWCTDLVSRLEPILYQYAIPYEYQPALRFAVPIELPHPDGHQEQVQLVGEMDLLVKEADKQWRVWDLKGTNDDNYWRKTVGQLVFYEIACKLMFGDWPVSSGLIQPMCKERVISFTFEKEQRMDMFYRISKVATDMWRGDVAPKASNAGCNRCEVQHACIKYKATPGQRVSFGRK